MCSGRVLSQRRLCVPDRPWSETCFAEIFSDYMDFLFTFLSVLFFKQKGFNFREAAIV